MKFDFDTALEWVYRLFLGGFFIGFGWWAYTFIVMLLEELPVWNIQVFQIIICLTVIVFVVGGIVSGFKKVKK